MQENMRRKSSHHHTKSGGIIQPNQNNSGSGKLFITCWYIFGWLLHFWDRAKEAKKGIHIEKKGPHGTEPWPTESKIMITSEINWYNILQTVTTVTVVSNITFKLVYYICKPEQICLFLSVCEMNSHRPTGWRHNHGPINVRVMVRLKVGLYKTSLLRRLRADPSRWRSTDRQNPPIQQNRRNF